MRIDYHASMVTHPSSTGRPSAGPDLLQLHRQAVELLGKRQFGAAQQCCLRILKENPQHADAHFLLGMIATEFGRVSNALEFIGKAIELEPERAEYHAHRGRCLALLKYDSEALAAADTALALEPADALTCDTIGVVCSRAGDHEKAVEAFRRAVSREPDNPGFQFNLGSSLKFLGQFDAAEAAFESAISVSPRFHKAHTSLSQLRRQTPERNHIRRLEGLIHNCGDNVDAELQLRHALAKELEDLGDYDGAYRNLSIGNAKKHRQIDYSIERDRALFDCITGLFTGEDENTEGSDNREPIFVIGMPRSGTTLIERILTSHSTVYSAGELQNFGIALKRAANTDSREVLDIATLEKALQIDFASLGQTYIDSTRPVTGHTLHFVDKMPLNFLYTGFIHRALPNARIICLRRNPLDTCLSNFRQLFALNFSYYNYAYDLLDTGRYYVLFDRLMKHWQRVLPGKILEVQYESVIENQEAESRRIIDYCGLDWEEACLAFEQNVAPVATASSVQVRQPLYAHAVNRWRHYEKYLDDLKQLLTAEGITLENT